MAKVMVVGTVATVEILHDPKDEKLVLAKCVLHLDTFGSWEERYDTTDDAIAGAEQHADGVR